MEDALVSCREERRRGREGEEKGERRKKGETD